MLTLSVAGAKEDVARGTLTLPLTGVWHGDFVINMDTVPSGSAIATLDGVDMPAHVQRAELVNGMVHLRIVGGAGGLAKPAMARHYRNPVVRHVLADLVRDAGETLSTTCTASTLGQGLDYWTTLGIPTGTLLQALAETAGDAVNWRILFDGTLWMGVETWPMCPADVRILEQDAPNASQYLGTDALGIWPGTTIAGRKVDSVVHEIGSAARSRVFWVQGHA
jgi:hypothetical protein